MLKILSTLIFITPLWVAASPQATEGEVNAFIAKGYYHSESTTWVQYGKVGRLQGIKLHISSPMQSEIYHRLLLKVLKILKENNFTHKLHRDFQYYLAIPQSDALYGKAITIYPEPYRIEELLKLLKPALNNFDWQDTAEEVISSDIKVTGIRNLFWRFGCVFNKKKTSLYVTDEQGYLGYMAHDDSGFQRFGPDDGVPFYSDSSDLHIPVRLSLYNLTIYALYKILKAQPNTIFAMEKLEDHLRKFSLGKAVIDDDLEKKGGQEECFGADQYMETLIESLNLPANARSKRLRAAVATKEFIEAQHNGAVSWIKNLAEKNRDLNEVTPDYGSQPIEEGSNLNYEIELQDDETLPLIERPESCLF